MAAPKSPSSGAFNNTFSKISECYICNKNIVPKEIYNEHIILNSLGGRLKSKSLICRQCASKLDKIDAALSRSLNSFGLLLNIPRDRGTNPPILATRTDTGERISLDSGGKPVVIKPIITDKLADKEQPSLYISAKDKPQMREILTGLKRKYPLLNVEELVNSAVARQEDIPPVIINLSFGEEEFRSVCKMAINFYMYHDGERDLISHLIPYIKDGCENQYVGYYYPDELIAASNSSESFIHTLYIEGNPQEKILYGYIELYSAFRLIILLSDSYEGDFFQKVYSFNVLSREEMEKEININVSRKEILNLVNNPEPPLKKIESAIKVLVDAIKLNQINKAINKDIEDFSQNIPEGTIVDGKMLQELFSKLKLSKTIFPA
ncbi:MAG: HNH endonuclease [Tychonema bourrellyi B0820]|uniref:HNH endonuclease n=1 Tax=Tychonema bourrellyi FEM_GT703 TaxID=2040638 RepID=A0A2G4F5C2_9CYAN|nr:HNH endonuclease [Tychonema bourrellyi]MDQ2098551.1 HNH endonuclease [Tychonema bourrellyi B0820]PHX56984.1 HNH endonuclease [Tychonema bourrellyi FEM_GT703]